MKASHFLLNAVCISSFVGVAYLLHRVFNQSLVEMEEQEKQGTGNNHYEFNLSAPNTVRTALIVQQAFKDVGITNPVHPIFTTDRSLYGKNPQYLKASAYSWFDQTLTKNINCLICLPDCWDYNSAVVYAVAGHEALHIKHYHQMIKSFSTAFLATFSGAMLAAATFGFDIIDIINDESLTITSLVNPLLTGKFIFNSSIFGIVAFYLRNVISRLCEKDADLSSAEQLNTANVLHHYFMTCAQLDEERKLKECPSGLNRILISLLSSPINIFRTHPHDCQRVDYLQRYSSTSSPLLFQGNRLKMIEQRESDILREHKKNYLTSARAFFN